MKFEIKDRDASGRICKFTTKNGIVTTPNLMPVINPNKMIISPKEMQKLFGVEIVITNSYIISQDKNLKNIALDRGIHKLLDFNGPIMCDSGAFQSYIYGKVDVKPTEIVKFQRDIGCDIGTILDIFITPDKNREFTKAGIKETIKRAKESIKIKGDMHLACTVQGSIFPDLRTKCAKELAKINADFFPIGGVVPLMENQKYRDLVKIIISSKQGLDPSKPVHLFGAGHPIIFPLAAALGCDFFDSSSYAKYAQDNRMIFPWGTEKIEEISEIPCNCPICSQFSISELKKMDDKERITEIAKHNLYVCMSELKKIRNAISNGSLWELVEQRARVNPYLLEALHELRNKKNKEWLEKFEPLSKKKALFYTGNHTIHRPLIYRTHNRLLEHYNPLFNITVLFPEGKKPYSRSFSREIKQIFRKNKKINIVFDSSLGPVPLELDEMYPFAQSVLPKILDIETEQYLTKIFEEFTGDNKLICWKGKDTLKEIEVSKHNKENHQDIDLLRIKAVCDMQFNKNAGDILLNGKIRIVKSKKTKKIRNIYCDGRHILSMRASDGMFTLKVAGGILLHDNFDYPNFRVVVNDDATSFIKEGKSVFAKFVVDADPNLRPMDECLIVDKEDNLLAIGRCLLNRQEMLCFKDGMAVKNREANI